MIRFVKYQGTGNDFILVNDLEGKINLSAEKIASLCHRRFGIGADGLMLLRKETGYDFRMVYFNSDGRESSMCGNGGRCIAAFAAEVGLVKNSASFVAIDGEHLAHLTPLDVSGDWIVSLKMKDVNEWELLDNGTFMNTGSPHFVKYVDELDALNVFEEGRKIRNNETYKTNGVNVNFIENFNEILKVRTYERGVEDETLSCGTGVTAAALTHSLMDPEAGNEIKIQSLGGKLSVRFTKTTSGFSDIWLNGPVKRVFHGEIE